jgi:hypothetical protein
MRPFEDRIPEEMEEKQEKLITLLRRAYSQEQQLPESVQQEAILFVEERLTRMKQDEKQLSIGQPGQVIGSSLLKQRSRLTRSKRIIQAMGALAAMLVVSALIGSTVLVFSLHTHHSQTKLTSPPTFAKQAGIPDSVDVKWNGLEMSMKVMPGPYFLGELLTIDVSLTNHTHPALLLDGKDDGTAIHLCSSYALRTKLTGGTSPYYALYTKPVPFVYSCGLMGNGPAFVPGQTIKDHFYVLLTSSGEVTLTGTPFFETPGSRSLPNPLLALHIHVASQVPANRLLSLQQQGSEVGVHAPTEVHLLYQTYILCQVSSTDRGTPGGDYWQTLTTNRLQRPQCPQMSVWMNGQWITKHWTVVLWKYAIGAVGYEVIQGQSTNTITTHR